VLLDRAGLEILDVGQCLRLLRSVRVGRVAVSSEAVPIIFPVNFGVLDASVVFRTGEGTKLDAAIRNASVAFEADAIHSVFETGWSVVVVGTAEEVLDATEIDRVTQMGLRSWAPGSRSHLIKIRPTTISGRRIVGEENA